MRIDERLRQGLGAGAQEEIPQLDERAAHVIERGRRRRTSRRAGTALAVVAVVAFVAVAVPKFLGAPEGGRPAGNPPAPKIHRDPSPLVGTYRLTVAQRAYPAQPLGAAGEWTLEIRADHTAKLTNAVDPAPWSPVFIAPETVTFHVLGDACGKASTARYAWGIYGHTVRFSVRDDPCELRAYLLHGPGRGHAWTRVAQG